MQEPDITKFFEDNVGVDCTKLITDEIHSDTESDDYEEYVERCRKFYREHGLGTID